MANNFTGCPEWFSDKTDFLRYEGFACPVPIIVDIVLWSLVLVAALRILAMHPASCRDQVAVHKRNLRSDLQRGVQAGRFCKHPPLTILFFSFTYILSMVALALVKLFARDQSTLGKDGAVSILFLYTTCVGFVTGNASHLQMVKTLLTSLSIGKSTERRLYLQLLIPTVLSTLLYVICVIASVLAGFIVGGDVEPMESPMAYVILLRHSAIVFVLCCGFQISRRLQTSTKKVVCQIASLGDTCGAKNDRLKRAMDKIASGSKKRKGLAAMAIIIYSIFSIPFFWPFQSCVIAFTLLLSLDPKASLPLRYKANPNSSSKVLNSTHAPTSRNETEKIAQLTCELPLR